MALWKPIKKRTLWRHFSSIVDHRMINLLIKLAAEALTHSANSASSA